MEISDVLDRIAELDEPPPAPPIFDDPGVDPGFWEVHFDAESGAEVWERLVEATLDTSRPEPVVSREAWEALVSREKIRRAQELWSIDHQSDGRMRPDPERAEIRKHDWAACARDFWRWLHRRGWIENPHASTADSRVVPLVCWPGQIAYLWWLRTGLEEGMVTGREAIRIINKARSVGVSWGFCHILAHRLLFERGFAGKVGSLTGNEVDDGTSYSLMGKIRYVWSQQPTYLLPDYPLSYEKAEEAIGFVRSRVENRRLRSVVRGENMTRNFGRSGRETVVVLDEFAGLPAQLQESIRTSSTSVSVSTWSVSTPRGRGNRFHREWEAAPDEQKLVIRWTLDPRRDDTWFENLLIENGGNLTWDQRAQEYDCSFAGITGHRIWQHDQEAVLYDEDDPDWQALCFDARRRWTVIGGMDFGDGPSATVYRGALVDWDAALANDEYGLLPRLWWDAEIYGFRSLPDEIGPRIVEAQGDYGGQWRVYGDPAGKHKLVRDIPSWESDLNRLGVPLVCLDEDPFARRYMLDKAIELVAEMMRLGLWRVHRRCTLSLTSEEQWAWDVPPGLTIEQVNKAAIKWKKDGPSHACEAGIYGAMAAIFYHQPRVIAESDALAGPLDGLGGELFDVWR